MIGSGLTSVCARARIALESLVMNRFIVAVVVAFGLSSPARAGARGPVPDNTLTAAERAAGWRLLFDGATGTGWRGVHRAGFPEVGWEIRDGVLTVLPAAGAESRHGGDLVTEEEFADFELTFDFRLTPGANSGVKYLVQESYATQGSAIGLEYQILDDDRHEDAGKGVGGNRTLASLYDLIPAEGRPLRPIGEWNHGYVCVRGALVEHWLNGARVVRYDRRSQAFRALVQKSKYAGHAGFGQQTRGRILLQDHGDRVSFKNLKLRPLPARATPRSRCSSR